MKAKILVLAASLAVAVPGEGAVVTYFWEETGSDVLLTVSGSLNVAGWASIGVDVNSTSATFTNADSGGVVQHLQINRPTSGGITYYNSGGTIDLPPWNTPTGADLSGVFQSGSYRGQIYIDQTGGSLTTAFIQTSDVVGGVYTFDAAYLFPGTTLNGMFGDGLAAWSSGAQIGTMGANQVWFTTAPEPTTAGLLAGAALVLAARRHRARSVEC
jgi:hypothetical protein